MWKITDNNISVNGTTLWQIKASEDALFRTRKGDFRITAGELGGFIQGEKNLSKDSWICSAIHLSGETVVKSKSFISGDVIIEDGAMISDCDIIQTEKEPLIVSGFSEVVGSVLVGGVCLAGSNYISTSLIEGDSLVLDSKIVWAEITKSQVVDSRLEGNIIFCGDVFSVKAELKGNVKLKDVYITNEIPDFRSKRGVSAQRATGFSSLSLSEAQKRLISAKRSYEQAH